MTLFYAFLIFILLILLSISVYYYFRLKHIMGIKTKDCEEKENSLNTIKSDSNFLKSKYDDLENKYEEEIKKKNIILNQRDDMRKGFKELFELSSAGPDWNWVPNREMTGALPISCVCN